MKIVDQNIQLQSQHQLLQQHTREQIHETFVNGQLATRDSLTLSDTRRESTDIRLSQGALDTYQRQLGGIDRPTLPQLSSALDRSQAADTGLDAENQLPPKLQKIIAAVEAMMERLTGRKVKLKVFGYQPNEQQTATSQPEKFNPTKPMRSDFAMPAFGQRWVWNEFYHEEEHSRFQANGQVTTADGRRIDFNLQANLSRQFTQQISAEKQQGVVFKDPLVVNLNGQPASLTVDKFEFDIDADGEKENISFVENGSGFLALDRNQDGVINDGSELFGAMSGNGFEELSRYDDDQNGWIDENDAIFSQLQIWQKDSQGFDRLSGLLEVNVGAIYLQNVSTEFALTDANNQQHGQIRSSGVFLHETGQAGTIQQIDLVV